MTLLHMHDLKAARAAIIPRAMRESRWVHSDNTRKHVSNKGEKMNYGHHPNFDMLYLRHRVFQAALLTKRVYDVFFYVREDNMFVVPLAEVPAFQGQFPLDNSP